MTGLADLTSAIAGRRRATNSCLHARRSERNERPQRAPNRLPIVSRSEYPQSERGTMSERPHVLIVDDDREIRGLKGLAT